MPQTALYLTIRVEWVKSLWTSNGDGNKVFVYTGTNEYDEARYIARQIKKHFDEQGSFSGLCDTVQNKCTVACNRRNAYA